MSTPSASGLALEPRHRPAGWRVTVVVLVTSLLVVPPVLVLVLVIAVSVTGCWGPCEGPEDIQDVGGILRLGAAAAVLVLLPVGAGTAYGGGRRVLASVPVAVALLAFVGLVVVVAGP